MNILNLTRKISNLIFLKKKSSNKIKTNNILLELTKYIRLQS